MIQLSTGICKKLHESLPGENDLFTTEHIVQVLSIKKLSQGTTDRYRLIISDGVNLIQVMIATQLNQLIVENQIDKHAIIALQKVSCNTIQDRR